MTPAILALGAASSLLGIVLCVWAIHRMRTAQRVAAASHRVAMNAERDLYLAKAFNRDALAALAAHPDPMVEQRERARRGVIGRDSRGRFVREVSGG